MRMTPKAAAMIFALTRRAHLGLSLRDQLTTLRRLSRDAVTAKVEYESYFRRETRSILLTAPKDTKRIAVLQFQQQALRDSQRRHAEHLCDILRGLDTAITSALDFDSVCELLGVNMSHRAEAREYFTQDRGAITTIVFIAGLEDSASSRSGRNIAETRSGPLFQIYMSGLYRQVRKTPGFFAETTCAREPPPTCSNRDDEPPTVH